MEQGSSASALATRTAGMTDEQILDLDLETLQTGGGVGAQGTPAGSAGTPGDFGDEWEAAGTSFSSQGAVKTSLAAEAPLTGDFDLGAVTSSQNQSSAPEKAGANAQGEPFGNNPQGEPAWLKQLETQPAAAAEARQWREASKDVAALDAAYFSGDTGARSGLATRLYESDPAAFREMLAESARMLASRDPQALAELARQLGVSEAQPPNAATKSLAQAARLPEPGTATQNQIAPDNRGTAAFPAEAYRAFESATNEDVARGTREAIERTLGTTLPEGIGDGARRRIGDDIFQEATRDPFQRSRTEPASGRDPARMAFRWRDEAADRVADFEPRSRGHAGGDAARCGGMDFVGAGIRSRAHGARGCGGFAARHHGRAAAQHRSGELAASAKRRLFPHE